VINNRYLTGNTPQTRYCIHRSTGYLRHSQTTSIILLVTSVVNTVNQVRRHSNTKLLRCCGDFYDNRGVPGVTHHSPRTKCLSLTKSMK